MKRVLALVVGILLGASGKDLIDGIVPKMQAKHPVGTCFSNGYYFEKIIEIRTSKVMRQKDYVTIGFLGGKKTLPETTPAWYIDDKGVVVDDKYCQ